MLPESNRRKILLVTNDLGPRSGGIETFIHGLLEKLDGSQIVILTSSQDGDVDFDKSNVKIGNGKIYIVEGKTVKNQAIELKVINYASKAVLKEISKK